MDTRASFLICLFWLLFRILLQAIAGDSPVGYWSLACDVLLIFLLIGLGGIPQAVSRIVRGARSRRDAAGELGILKHALLSAALFGILCGGLLYLLAPQICLLFFGKTMQETAFSLQVMAPSVLCLCISGVLRGYFQGIGSPRPGITSQFLFVITSCVSGVIAAFPMRSREDAYAAAAGALAFLLGSFVSMLFLLVTYLLYRPGVLRRAHKDKLHEPGGYVSFLKSFFVGFGPYVLSTGGILLLILCDAVLFAHITGYMGYEADLISVFYGIYSGKLMLPIFLSLAIILYAVPAKAAEISSAYVHGQNLSLLELTQGFLRYAMTIALPVFVTAAVIGDAANGLLFGDFSDLTRKIILAGAPLILFVAYAAASSAVMAGIDRMKKLLLHGLTAFALHILFLVILLQYSDMNLYALLYSDTVFAFTLSALNTVSLIRGISFRQDYIRTYFLPAAASAVMGGGAFLVYHGLVSISFPAGWAALLALLVCLFVYPLVLIRIRGIRREEMGAYPLGKAAVLLAEKLHIF